MLEGKLSCSHIKKLSCRWKSARAIVMYCYDSGGSRGIQGCERTPLWTLVNYWGEPERAPHLWIKRKIVYIYVYIYIYLFIYIYIWYVRIPYMHSALFVRDAIFQQ